MSEKSRRETFGRNFGKIQTDFHDFSVADLQENFLCICWDFHVISTVLLPCLMKFENSKNSQNFTNTITVIY